MPDLRPIELLAPAGNAEVALAAFDGGADAVYCGLGRFNARLRAENFTPDTLHRVIDFAHTQGKKVYVTLNTLIFDSELRALGEQLETLTELEPDALIIQDIGVAEIVRRYFPHFRLHASTQMGIHNSAGVEYAARHDFARVILERQLELAEIRAIAERAPIELEVFIHGSLCCSLSGQCQWSQQLYGASGNRGVCKQPCRKRFNGKFFFSPADLCGIDYVDELRKWGIASLKIEGRLRGPEYVWKVSRAYRLICDATPSDAAERRREAEVLLGSAAGRSAGSGFFDPHSRQKLIDPDVSGNFGKRCAKIRRVTPEKLVMTLVDRLHLGDRVRLVSASGGEIEGAESFSVTRMLRNDREILCGKRGDEVDIPGSFPAQAVAGYLFKIGENGFDFSRRVRQLPPPRIPVDLQVKVTPQGIAVTSPQLPDWQWRAELEFAAAQNRALTPEALREIFAFGAGEKYRVRHCTCQVEGNIFAPVSTLKQLRREFWAAAAEHWQPDKVPHRAAEFYAMLDAPASADEAPELSAAIELPTCLPEPELSAAERRLAELLAACPGQTVAATHFHHLEMMKKFPGHPMIARFPLVVANRFAAAALQKDGVVAAEIAPEVPERVATDLRQTSPIALLVGAEPPAMATRIPLQLGKYRDDAGNVYSVSRAADGKRFFLRREP